MTALSPAAHDVARTGRRSSHALTPRPGSSLAAVASLTRTSLIQFVREPVGVDVSLRGYGIDY
ncbi:hypothetical protein [Actinomyces haliotis]|uniref:hypothetical protein n=1 Tax=Actinomyces haliotis TaxID=1280843 RepID=UPI00188DC76B|nr:hypothetical protein [Actinomyces haliotis]